MGLEMAVAHAAKSRWFRSNIAVVCGRIAAVSNHGSFTLRGPQNRVCYRTGTPTLAADVVSTTEKTKIFGDEYKTWPRSS